MNVVGNWNYPTPVRFGPGRVQEIPAACRELGMTRPLLVTDPGLARLPMIGEALERNRDAGLPTGLFRDVRGNPVGDNVSAGVRAFFDGGHDGVVAFGGGSALDVAKAVALMVGQNRSLWDFEDVGDNWLRVNATSVAPVVAVPTTSGTGSEVGRASVITDTAARVKRIIFHPTMLPGRVICDPELTVGLPADLTAWVGMDALSHNLEAYCAPGFHPLADGIALEGMRLVHRALERAVRDGSDLEARAWMMSASLMGATAFQKGLGAMHALSHPLGAVLDLHHGLSNAVVMPYVLVHNRAAIAERLARAAAYIGLEPTFDGFLGWVLALREAVGIPATLGALGVGIEHAEGLAPLAAIDPSGGTNPLPLDIPSLEGLYRASIAGA